MAWEIFLLITIVPIIIFDYMFGSLTKYIIHKRDWIFVSLIVLFFIHFGARILIDTKTHYEVKNEYSER